MNDLQPSSTPLLSDEDIRVCVRVLRAIEADRSHLTRLTQEQRRELLTLAGLVSKPERHDLVRMAKAFRRAERQAGRDRDREMLERAGLRVQRQSPVYAPLWLEPPRPADLDDRAAVARDGRVAVGERGLVVRDVLLADAGEVAGRQRLADVER